MLITRLTLTDRQGPAAGDTRRDRHVGALGSGVHPPAMSPDLAVSPE